MSSSAEDPTADIAARLAVQRAIQRFCCANHRWHGIYAADIALNPTDVQALSQIANAGQISPGALSERLVLTPGGTNGVLRRLQAARLITRDTSPADRRDVTVTVTGAGMEVVTGLAQRPLGNLPATMTPPSCDRLVAALNTLTTLLEDEATRLRSSRPSEPEHDKIHIPAWG